MIYIDAKNLRAYDQDRDYKVNPIPCSCPFLLPLNYFTQAIASSDTSAARACRRCQGYHLLNAYDRNIASLICFLGLVFETITRNNQFVLI